MKKGFSLFVALVLALSLAVTACAEIALPDGVYAGEGSGFNLTVKVPVEVEIKEGKIAAVTVGENGETMGMIAAAQNLYIPRVIETQSLSVDAITGATVTSKTVQKCISSAVAVVTGADTTSTATTWGG